MSSDILRCGPCDRSDDPPFEVPADIVGIQLMIAHMKSKHSEEETLGGLGT